VVLGSVSGLGVLAVGGIRTLNYHPEAREVLEPVCIGPEKVLKAGDEFSVLSWNIQFSASREEAFFYDGGEAVHVPRERVERTMEAIASFIREQDPDVVFLQEVDRDSARTARIDQLQTYLEAGEWACYSSTPYHRSRYVPHPSSQHLGRVDMHLAILSRFSLGTGERVALPGLSEGWLRRQFNLRRALQWVELPVEGGTTIRLGNTHLSAFSQGDGTLGHQVAVLQSWMGGGTSWILAGDMNLLPPGDDANRLEGSENSYADDPNPAIGLEPLRYDVARSALLEESERTYVPFGATKPDRKIDYLLSGEGLELVEHQVLRGPMALSDHLPIRAVFRVK
jgi:endonuclease/exonuclease/phosphatase family metal-dependent hydrolase